MPVAHSLGDCLADLRFGRRLTLSRKTADYLIDSGRRKRPDRAQQNPILGIFHDEFIPGFPGMSLPDAPGQNDLSFGR
jgi:hypothetical protein